ncbi:uncharacterized protein MONOS_5611 [Monocercomonoides exilis]|uniref:uncharacterized protein n=1 Tax=Monocercomonoides exilis TaxID=2049356 RepID=UPI00355ACC7B|nr:hypothetical protein MONOS_5611 [Monocercomonoides exilis]|eukprot:MONOS_5611.1-p1 / transcript=MONOS_5611.1 / gene=MONOS_5611 / organism=Monocercomonoides_exilis_PA203 / gene_product=unspecified product / transcript_product=unspecified product / location=Mono_scaffold00165:48156-48392(-) / protein_length=79 / sequence_SO=supercontig / SO=protein_coding / is_pseudo=false
MQHGTESETRIKQAISEEFVVMDNSLVEWFEHKAEEFEFVIDIYISQDELNLLANVHIVMKQWLLYCGVKASVVMEHR